MKQKNQSFSGRGAAPVFFLCILMLLNVKLNVYAEDDTTWQEEYEYSISEGEITLQKYTGAEQEITVPAVAVIDGEAYSVVLGEAQQTDSGYAGIWSMNESVTSLDFEEGIKLPEDCTTLFRNCKSLREIDLSELDTTGVVSMAGMFAGCSSLKEIDISGFEMADVTDMQAMFSDCSDLKTVTFGDLSTRKVTDMTALFQNCRSLRSVSLGGLDASHITSMNQMFAGCSSLENLDLQDFHPGDLHSMRRTFADCSALKWIRFGSIDTGKVTTMEGCFSGCSSLSQLDLSAFATGSLVVAGEMFAGCSGISTLDLSTFDLRNVRGEVSYGDGSGPVTKDMLRDVRADRIITPRYLKEDVALSAVYIEESSGTIYRQLPKDSSFPRILVKMSYDAGAQLVVSGDEILYYEDGEQDFDTYGFVSYDNGLFLVAHGRVASEINGLYQDPEYPQFWYYCSEGQAHTEYSGVVEYDGEKFLVKDGVLDTGTNGFCECDGGMYVVAAGRILQDAEGLIQDPKHRDCWYYCRDGRVVQDLYGTVWYDGAEFYVSGGRFRAVY